MIRLHNDVDGCGCIHCQNVDHRVVRRSLGGALLWSSGLLRLYPSIVLVFLAVGFIQAVGELLPPQFALLTVLGAVLGVFVGRGYIGVIGRATLGDRQSSPTHALWLVARRFPAFLGATVAVIGLLAGISLLVLRGIGPLAGQLLVPLGVDPFQIQLLVLLVTALCLVSLIVKLYLVPEACFVGGYGPLESLRVSWRLTSLHPKKAVLIVIGFGLLLAVRILFDSLVSNPQTPVALTFQLGETTLVLRSFGLALSASLGGLVRFGFDLFVTAVYSGVFVHQYVSGAVSEA